MFRKLSKNHLQIRISNYTTNTLNYPKTLAVQSICPSVDGHV